MPDSLEVPSALPLEDPAVWEVAVLHRISAILIASVLGGCSIGAPPDALYPVAPGMTLVVTRPIEVPADATELWFQNGTAYRHLKEFWDPYCRLRLRGDHERPRTIATGRFRVTRVRSERIVGARQLPRLAAAPGAELLLGSRAGGDGGDAGGNDPMYFAREVVIELESSEQPDVRRLSCARRQAVYPVSDLTREEVRTALGDYARFEG